MEFFKAAPEQLAKFVDFVVVFGRSPQTALQPYAATGAREQPHLNGQLILFCALTVGCAALMMTIGQALGMADDRSWTVAVISRLDPKALPLVVTFAVIVVSAIWHGITRAVGVVLGGLVPDLRFDGAIENSMNAGLAFATFYTLALSGALVAIRLAVAHLSHTSIVYLVVSISLGISLGLAFLVYFVLAFAAVHHVPPARYFLLFAVTAIPIKYLVSLLS